MPYVIAGLVAGCLLLLGLLESSYTANGEITAQNQTLTQERDDAKAQADAVAEASRKQRGELARLRKQAAGQSAAVVAASDDCLDRRHGDDIGDALRMLDPDGEADAPGPG